MASAIVSAPSSSSTMSSRTLGSSAAPASAWPAASRPYCCPKPGPGHGKPAVPVGDQDRDQFVELVRPDDGGDHFMAVPPSAESWSIRRPAIMLVNRAPRGLHAAHAAELA